MQQPVANAIRRSSFPHIAANVRSLLDRIERAAAIAKRDPQDVTLVAVCKTFPAPLVAEAHRVGIRHFGENRVQEAAQKMPALAALEPRPTWHMVGHLQTNKVTAALELFDLIQSVDSVRLGEAIARRSTGRRVPLLLEVNVAEEPSKYGFRPQEVPAAVHTLRLLAELEVRGLMTVAPLVDNPEAVRPVFRKLRDLANRLGLSELSMGMTDDFEMAVQEGATIIRVGRAIFGPRPSA